MGTVKDFILSVKLREGLKFDHKVADLINVDSAKLANWKSRESLPTSYQKWYCDRYNIELKDFNKEVKLTNPDIDLEADDNLDKNQKYMISLQKDKIESIEKDLIDKNNQLDIMKKNPVQSALWEQITPDFETEVQIKPKMNWFAMGMMIKQVKMTGNGKWAEKLGITEQQLKDYLDFGKWHEWGKSPIEQIMVKDSKDAITNEIPTLEQIINFVKNLTGDHYYSKTVVYKHKSNTVITHCASRIKWWESPKTVITKNTILEPNKIN